jgi:hypothetical protein
MRNKQLLDEKVLNIIYYRAYLMGEGRTGGSLRHGSRGGNELITDINLNASNVVLCKLKKSVENKISSTRIMRIPLYDPLGSGQVFKNFENSRR